VIEDAPFPMEEGRGNYALTRHRDIADVSRHPEIFTSGRGAVSLHDLPQEMVQYFSGLISTDDPRHARLRRVVSNAFSPKRVTEIERMIDEIARAIVGAVAGNGSCDFATQVAAPLPLRVVCQMMGVPPSEEGTVLACANTILSGGDPEYVTDGVHPLIAFVEAAMTLVGLMTELSEHRVTAPVDDLTSVLLHADVDGEAMTPQELSSFFVELVIAGSETTRTAISHGLLALTQYPAQRAIWKSDFDLVSRSAVEEVVRWASPVIWMRRTVAVPTELSGISFEPGDKVVLYYWSANRDEDVFVHPASFDVRRDPNPHFGFGAPGPHFCLGAHLARREITSMFRELFHRVPDIAASGEPDRLRSSFMNGIKHLPCTFSPQR
jgi:cytochrome P450